MTNKKISALTVAATPLAGTEVLPIVQSSATVKVSVANLTAGRAVNALSITADNTGYATPVANFQSGDQSGARVAVINSGSGGQTYHLVTGNPGVSNSGFALYDSTNSATRLYVGSSTGDLTLATGNLVVASGKGIDFSATAGTGTSELFADYEEGTWTPVCARQTGGAISAVYGTQLGKYTKVGNLVTVSALIDITSVSSQGTGENRVTGLPYAPANNSLGAGAVARGTAFLVDIVISCWGWTDSEMRFSNNTSASGTSSGWKAGLVVFTFSYFV